jgi:hypothetical protein
MNIQSFKEEKLKEFKEKVAGLNTTPFGDLRNLVTDFLSSTIDELIALVEKEIEAQRDNNDILDAHDALTKLLDELRGETQTN